MQAPETTITILKMGRSGAENQGLERTVSFLESLSWKKGNRPNAIK